jgi:hypothetical protein
MFLKQLVDWTQRKGSKLRKALELEIDIAWKGFVRSLEMDLRKVQVHLKA